MIFKYLVKGRFLAFLLCSLAFSLSSFAQPDGKKLFKTNCASCHALDKDMTGPGLKGVLGRIPSEEWGIRWVRNFNDLVKEGDAYALDMVNFAPSDMNTFPTLSDEEIKAILVYVDNPPVEAAVASNAAQGGTDSSLDTIYWVAIVAIIIFAIAALVLSRVVGVLTTISEAADKSTDKSHEDWVADLIEALKLKPLTLKAILTSNKFKVPAIILILVFAATSAFDFHSGLGIQHEYAPDQPIAFSHKIHAGINKIDCQYCHSGAKEGKTATIPSLNVCMNCHKAIDSYSNEATGDKIFTGGFGTDEIHKIYDYLAIDPSSKEPIEGKDAKAIEWIKVHNLPDHVYFNHAQHVVAGEVECQTCHGDVENMEILEKQTFMSMGWCVNCHRDTEVKFQTNGYYSEFEELHKDFKEKKKITVEDIGGTDCQKCHY